MPLQNYEVPDLVLDWSAVDHILLCESPFKDEVATGRPLSGDSGLQMSAALVPCVPAMDRWNASTPFGELISTQTCTTIGLMNCSTLPMDRKVYVNDRATYLAHKAHIDALDLIRRGPWPATERRRDPNTRQVEEDLLRNLQARLEKIPVDRRESVVVVPCGDVARSLLKKCNLTWVKTISKSIPHPARNRWCRSEHGESIVTLAKSINGDDN